MKKIANKTFKIIILCFSVMLFFGGTVFANTAKVESTIDKEQMYVGDRVRCELFVFVPYANARIAYPEKADSFGNFEKISSKLLKRTVKKNETIEKYEYIFTTFDVGHQAIPPITIKFKRENEENTEEISSISLDITVLTVLTDESKDIKGLKPLWKIKRSKLLFVFLIVCFLGILGVLYAMVIRKKADFFKEQKEQKPHEKAYTALYTLRAKDLPMKGKSKEFYTELSAIVRQYIEDRFCMRAPEMTTEEFINFVKNSDLVTRDQKNILKMFLFECDKVKFAKHLPKQIEMLDSFKIAENFVDETKLIEEENEDDV